MPNHSPEEMERVQKLLADVRYGAPAASAAALAAVPLAPGVSREAIGAILRAPADASGHPPLFRLISNAKLADRSILRKNRDCTDLDCVILTEHPVTVLIWGDATVAHNLRGKIFSLAHMIRLAARNAGGHTIASVLSTNHPQTLANYRDALRRRVLSLGGAWSTLSGRAKLPLSPNQPPPHPSPTPQRTPPREPMFMRDTPSAFIAPLPAVTARREPRPTQVTPAPLSGAKRRALARAQAKAKSALLAKRSALVTPEGFRSVPHFLTSIAELCGRRFGRQAELAKYLGTNSKSVTRWLRAEQFPQQPTLDAMRQWYGMERRTEKA